MARSVKSQAHETLAHRLFPRGGQKKEDTTTAIGATVAPEKTVVIPCLHDENSAYQPVFRSLLAESAQVWSGSC